MTLTAFAGLGDRVQPLAATSRPACRRPPTPPRSPARCSCPRTSATRRSRPRRRSRRRTASPTARTASTITTAAGQLPNQLKVTISVNTKNPWGAHRQLQLDDDRAQRGRRVPAAPEPREPAEHATGTIRSRPSAQPQFWGNIFGPSSNKDKGDAIQAAPARRADAALCNADNCPSWREQGLRRERVLLRHRRARRARPARSNVQVFDPAFVHVGDNCGDSDANAQNSLEQRGDAHRGADPRATRGTITPAVRYASAGSSAFCTGDNYYGDGSNTANPWTVWTLRAPDISTWDPTNNPIVCQAEFPGVYPGDEQRSAQRHDRAPTQLKTLLQQATNYPGTNPARTLRVVLPAVGARSAASPARSRAPTSSRCRRRRRSTAPPRRTAAARTGSRSASGLGSNFATTNGLHVYGNQKMGVYANATGAEHAVLPDPGAAR